MCGGGQPQRRPAPWALRCGHGCLGQVSPLVGVWQILVIFGADAIASALATLDPSPPPCSVCGELQTVVAKSSGFCQIVGGQITNTHTHTRARAHTHTHARTHTHIRLRYVAPSVLLLLLCCTRALVILHSRIARELPRRRRVHTTTAYLFLSLSLQHLCHC